ncbi:hypothetical protein GOV07_01635 [Candidatus Woesearchaeota archaeon]|nr:hypothetical protein [Candidatus Woesearchaeota archaeon]
MPLNKLKRQTEERRLGLIDTLQKGKDAFELSKQHQLYGAIKELEHTLKAIDFFREEQIKGADFELKREGPPALSTRMGNAMKSAGAGTVGIFASMGRGLHNTVIKGTGRVFKRGGRRIRMYKEVMKEVKKRDVPKKPKPEDEF